MAAITFIFFFLVSHSVHHLLFFKLRIFILLLLSYLIFHFHLYLGFKCFVMNDYLYYLVY